MNTSVSATGMKIQAQSEGGILISNVKTVAGPWNDTYNFNMASGIASKPTSTADTDNWYHVSSSSNVDADAKGSGSLSSGDYATLDLEWIHKKFVIQYYNGEHLYKEYE